jgi:hypothetical protein
MCTVTFLPLLNADFILTSNRDEKKQRETSPPKMYVEDGINLFFPKDKLGGGTWIGTSSKNRLVCVLNGGFVKHKKKSSYTKSRGLIAKELLKTDDLLNYIEKINLNGIEPFTMVIVDWSANKLNLFELIWDEQKKHFNALKNEPKIWSSSTLYTKEIKLVREKWFQNWLNNHQLTLKNILQFHHSEIGDKQQAVLMKRSTIETVSITSIQKKDHLITMRYEDVVHSKKYKISLK